MKIRGIYLRGITGALMLAALFAIAAAGAQKKQPALQDGMNSVVVSYLKIQGLLATDKPAVQKDAKAISGQVDATLKLAGKDDKLKAALGTVKTAAAAMNVKGLKLDAAREKFGALSDAVIALVNGYFPKELSAKYYTFYCGMAKKHWLQSDKETRNPYFGSQMLKCGKLVSAGDADHKLQGGDDDGDHCSD